MTVVKRYEQRPNPVEVVEIREVEDLYDPEFAEFVDHLFRWDGGFGGTLHIYDVEERAWDETTLPATIAKFKDGHLEFIGPGFLSDYKEITGGKLDPMPPIAEFTAIATAPDWVIDQTDPWLQ